MQETRPPEGGVLREAFAGATPEAVEAQMIERFEELKDEGHELLNRQQISFPRALVIEIQRCEVLLEDADTPMNKAALRSALNEARDTLGKMERLRKRAVRSFENLKRFK
jgi:hypothetical protein